MLSKRVFPYFQPIMAADTNDIYSYEALGRYEDDDGEVKSLGDFFSDKSVSRADALSVDRVVRKLALEKFAREGGEQYLFINLRLDWIDNFNENPEEAPTVKWAREFGVDLKKIVIEITEEEFFADKETVADIINYYRKIGCRIAIDDYGKGASDIDRLAMISPDILKIDMDCIHKSEQSYHYREYIKSISSFAERVGIEVLYEGIENQAQLDFCIGAKGRYYQGFLLAKPQPSIRDASADRETFISSACRLVTALHEKSERVNARREQWDLKVEEFFEKRAFDYNNENINDYFSQMLAELSPQIKRIFLCNRWGEQLSYNIETRSGGVKLSDCRHRNWSWRGYFQESMIILDAGLKSHLTPVYRDVTAKEKIYTYIRPINRNIYLFIDILHAEGG
ncbi:MAG: EAL domain-containing protein [Oscillospiraceae bacterium]|jgi:EAL domain-containing protein (putative c-di-GMP-specific phosphodiesterase class I)|nr:EAL domain-containing protein [Oscillospiraceae bacterium]